MATEKAPIETEVKAEGAPIEEEAPEKPRGQSKKKPAPKKEPKKVPFVPPKKVLVRVVVGDGLTLGQKSVYVGEVHEVPWRHYAAAAAVHPGALLIRLQPGGGRKDCGWLSGPPEFAE